MANASIMTNIDPSMKFGDRLRNSEIGVAAGLRELEAAATRPIRLVSSKERSRMTFSVPLSAEEQAALLAQARAQGISLDALLRKAVLQVISAARKPELLAPLSAEELDKAFEEIADMIPEGIPPVSDEALSREKL